MTRPKRNAAQRAYSREWSRRKRIRLRAEWFEANGPCAHCGTNENLQVDHIDPATKVSCDIWGWAKERREAELAKCQALCVDCHKVKSAGERLKGEEKPQAKITEKDVIAIRESSLSAGVLAKVYGIDRSQITRIRRRERWKHVP